MYLVEDTPLFAGAREEKRQRMQTYLYIWACKCFMSRFSHGPLTRLVMYTHQSANELGSYCPSTEHFFFIAQFIDVWL